MSPSPKDILSKEVTRKEFLRITFLVVVASFGIYGAVSKLLSQAASPYKSEDANAGKLTGGAKGVANSSSATGEVVEFEVTTTTPPPSAGKVIMGSYSNYDGASTHTAYMKTLGITNVANTCLLDFLNNATWPDCWSTTGGLGQYASFSGTKMLGVPMAMSNAFRDWSAVTGGGQDASYKSMFEWCIANNIHLIRMGWEFTDGWPPWGMAGVDTAANQQGFIACWQHIVNLARSVSGGSAFKFIFNPDAGISSYFTDWATGYYPGDDYVDIIGVDVYDKLWNYTATWSDSYFENQLNNADPPTIPQIVAFAKAHDKALAMPEWGCWPFSNTANTSCAPGDDPGFVEARMSWAIAQAAAGQTVYMIVWNDGAGIISSYTNSLNQLKSSVSSGIASGNILH